MSPTSRPTQESRSAPRQKTLLRGFAYFANSTSAFDCVIRDISETGARLKFAAITPDHADVLELHIPVRGQIFCAQVKWSAGDEIGVAFPVTRAVSKSPTTDNDIFARVNRLETEIDLLKQQVRRMQKYFRSHNETI